MTIPFPLHVACFSNCPKRVARLVAHGADVNALDDQGQTPLHVACAGGWTLCVDALLHAGADTEVKNAGGDTPLVVACRMGASPCVRHLLAGGADRHVRTRDDLTPMHVACARNHYWCSLALITRSAGSDRADVNAVCSRTGETPLHTACANGALSCVKLLLANGASPTCRTHACATPAQLARAKNYTPCVRACKQSVREREARGGVCERCLCDGAATVRAPGTRLRAACAVGHAVCVASLLAGGEDVNAVSHKGGRTPLHKASAGGFAAVARILLRAGAHVDTRDAEGRSPLFLACERGHAECVRTLVLEGDANTSSVMERWSSYTARVQRALSDGVRGTPSVTTDASSPAEETTAAAAAAAAVVPPPSAVACVSAARDTHETVEEASASTRLHQGGQVTDVHTCGKTGWTPLHVACWRNAHDIVRCLLDAGFGVNVRETSANATPLYVACYYGQAECVRTLLDAGADVDARAAYGTSALHAACSGGHAACVDALLKRGEAAVPPARVNAVTEGRATPLHAACAVGSDACVHLLLAAGANVEATDVEGGTPLYRAAERGHASCVRALLAAGARAHAVCASAAGVGTPATIACTPLYIACERGHIDCVRALLGLE